MRGFGRIDDQKLIQIAFWPDVIVG